MYFYLRRRHAGQRMRKSKSEEEELWFSFVSWENLVILDHPVPILVPLPPQVYRAIALLFF